MRASHVLEDLEEGVEREQKQKHFYLYVHFFFTAFMILYFFTSVFPLLFQKYVNPSSLFLRYAFQGLLDAFPTMAHRPSFLIVDADLFIGKPFMNFSNLKNMWLFDICPSF